MFDCILTFSYFWGSVVLLSRPMNFTFSSGFSKLCCRFFGREKGTWPLFMCSTNFSEGETWFTFSCKCESKYFVYDDGCPSFSSNVSTCTESFRTSFGGFSFSVRLRAKFTPSPERLGKSSLRPRKVFSYCLRRCSSFFCSRIWSWIRSYSKNLAVKIFSICPRMYESETYSPLE